MVSEFYPQASVVQIGDNTLITFESISFRKNIFDELSYVYNQIGEFDQAIKAAKITFNLNNKYAKPWARLGDIYYKQRKLDKVVENYEEAIILDETYAYPHYFLGLIQFELKNYQNAEKHCEKV